MAGLRFHRILGNVERLLQLTLESARIESNHSGTIGDGAENAVRDTLRKYLPSGYGVGEGHVYDAYGDGSRQTDIVITNPEHPLTFPDGTSGTYVVDGVAAAGEVKSRLTTAELADCIEKGTAFKQLRMTINNADRVMTANDGNYMKQIGLVPPFFVVAFENQVADDTIGTRLRSAGLVSPPPGKSMGAEDWADTPQPPLDALCILGRGVWLYVRPNNPMGMAIGFEQSDGSRTRRPDLSEWVFMGTDAPLAWTLAWLHAAMPRVYRGGSVFRPYLIPPVRHIEYMNREPAGATASDTDANNAREGDASDPAQPES